MSKSNKICAAVIAVLGILLIIFCVMWYRCYRQNRELKVSVNNNYDRAFFELTDYVSDIDAMLSKAQLASDPSQLASISNEIFMKAAEAKSCFGQLPTENTNLENTAKFLSQVGDYTYVLSQNMINGAKITDEEYSNLNSLNEYASALSKSLSDIEQKIYSGEVSFNVASSGGAIEAMAAGDGIFKDLENVEKSFDNYPSLIYDGPFSEHIENMESYMLKGAAEISKKDALQKAKEFLGGRGEGLLFETETANTAIEAYNFGKDDNGNHITISITKKGGYVLYFLENKSVSTANYDIDAATGLAYRFLISHGINDMTNSYYEVGDNIATINFAYSQNGTKCYSDLIKVKVALDDGTIVGMECKGYLMNHRHRDIPDVMLSEAEAKSHVSTHLEVRAASLAVIPKDSLREVLCYEFKGTYMNKNFIVYVNAETGKEEQILLLIESETGVLTI
ncbi:MAG: germination protein YpeB [Candidatus Ornithomonoglobus sp.]